jgi:hypothetical protein
MGTFLVTPRMNPALRARVERAVSHRTRARRNAAALGIKGTFAGRETRSAARVIPVALAATMIVAAVLMVRHDRKVLEAERAALLSDLADRRATMPAGHETFLARTDRWITSTAGADAPDLVDPALRAPGALDALLRRPAVYVHGAAVEMHEARGVDDAARSSDKDAFLVCLLQPPKSATERALLDKVKGVYFGGAKIDDETASVRRLAEARLGLAAIGPAVESATRAATELAPLHKLRRDLTAAPLDKARKATAAELLLVVADAGPDARVALVDLGADKVLLRLRRHLEAPAASPQGALHREQMEACNLAYTVRRAVEE